MKKKLFLGLLAAAAVTFTACQKDEVISEVIQDEAISFSTYLGRDAQTKATVTNLVAMQLTDYSGFGVYATHTGTDNYDAEHNTYSSNFMFNENVDYNTSTSAWEYTNAKYWPDDSQKISFFAYAPYTNDNINNNTKHAGKLYTNSTMEKAPYVWYDVDSDVSKQIDLLYATPVKNATKSNIPLTDNNKVKLTFNHALSRIGFKAKTTNANSNNNKINIKSITLTGNFTTSGKFSLEDGELLDSTITASTAYTLNFSVPDIKGNTATNIEATEKYLMIIPTNEFRTNSDISISVNYDLSVYDEKCNNNYSAAVNKTETGTIDGFKFYKGKAYTIVLTISPDDPIEFDVAPVEEWDEEDNEKEINVPTPTV